MKIASRIAWFVVPMFAMTGVVAAQDPQPKEPQQKEPQQKEPQQKDTQQKPMMEKPVVPPELNAMSKQLQGTWNCAGKAWSPDGSEMDVKGTLKLRPDLDGFWIHDSLEARAAAGRDQKKPEAMEHYKRETFTTYNAKSQQWRKVSVDNTGTAVVGMTEAASAAGNQLEFTGLAMGPMGQSKLRERVDLSDLKTGIKVTCEQSSDDGKTWKKDHEVVCKK